MAPESLLESLALEHAGNGLECAELRHLYGAHLFQPFAVEPDSCLCRIEDLEDLRLVGLGVLQHIVLRQDLARFALACGIADHAGEIAYEECHFMAKVLELAHLLQKHGMAEMYVRGRGVET